MALPNPIPMPTGHVSSTTSQADGIVARRMPNTPISARPIVIARRVPMRAARYAATGANRPIQRTGIVPSSPTTACEVPNASWIEGINGPTPTIWGRNVSAARNNATSVAVGRLVTSSERNQRRAQIGRRRPQHDGHFSSLRSRLRMSRAETSTCLRASRPAALRLPERIASISLTWRSAACSGSM